MSIEVRPSTRLGLRQSSQWAVRCVLHLSDLLDSWSERRRQRRALLELGDHLLKDIGIGRGEAYREGRKPFWRD